MIDEITARFDKDKLMLEVDMKAAFMNAEALDRYYDMGIGSAMLKHIDCTKSFTDAINSTKMDIMIRDGLIRNDLAELLSFEKTGIYQTFVNIATCLCISLSITRSSSLKNGSAVAFSIRVIRTLT